MSAVEDHDGLDTVAQQHVDHRDAVTDVLIRLLAPGQLLRASEGAFVQPTVGIDGDALAFELFHVRRPRRLFEEGQQPRYSHVERKKRCQIRSNVIDIEPVLNYGRRLTRLSNYSRRYT